LTSSKEWKEQADMIKWSETVMKKKTIALFFALMIIAFSTGCQAIKKVFVKPPPEGLTQESYPVKVYAYESSVVVKETPQELIKHFSDFSALEQSMGIIQIEVADSSLGMDMIEVGQSFDVNLKLLGFNFPCQVICFKYKPDKELWLMVLTDGTWALLRFEFKPIPEGSMVNLNVLGQPSKTLAALLETFPLLEATAGRLDLIMAFIQSEFDPELVAKQLTEKGLRGELYETFLQAYEASVFVNSSPENFVRFVLDPDNFRDIINNAQTEGLVECLYEPENRRKWENQGALEPIFCPATITLAEFKWKFDSFTTININNYQDFLTIYGIAAVADILFKEQLAAQPEKGGTQVRLIVVIEPPGPATANLMSTMVTISGLPRLLEKLLLGIKAGVEELG
jgi:hypothetical protein